MEKQKLRLAEASKNPEIAQKLYSNIGETFMTYRSAMVGISPYTVETQIELIDDFYHRCTPTAQEGKQTVIVQQGERFLQVSGTITKHNKGILTSAFPMLFGFGFMYANDAKKLKMCGVEENYNESLIQEPNDELIKVSELFNQIRAIKPYSVREERSIFFQSLKTVRSESERQFIISRPLKYDFLGIDIFNSNRQKFDEIIDGFNRHWQGHIPTILDHIVLGKFIQDKKSVWFSILAPSNFGKSKLFKFMEKWGGTCFVSFNDIAPKNGAISNLDPVRLDGKLSLVIDEVLHFKRELYSIEDTLTLRPMRNHSIDVPINSRYLLSADGGFMNAESMDSQVVNRIALLDFRKTETISLGNQNWVKKYGKATVQASLEFWLYLEVKSRIEEYEKLDRLAQIDRADSILESILSNYGLTGKKDIMEDIAESLHDILASPRTSLSRRVYEDVRYKLSTRVIEGVKGYVVFAPRNTVNVILSDYADDIKYTVRFKTMEQIVDAIEGAKLVRIKDENGKRPRVLFVPEVNYDEKEIADSRVSHPPLGLKKTKKVLDKLDQSILNLKRGLEDDMYDSRAINNEIERLEAQKVQALRIDKNGYQGEMNYE